MLKKKIKAFEPFDCKFSKYGKENFLDSKDGGLIRFFILEKEKMYESILKNVQTAIENEFDYADVIKFKNSMDVLIMKKIDFDYFLINAINFYSLKENYEKCEKIKKLREKFHTD